MQKNKKILIVAGVIILAGVFYGGMLYGESRTPSALPGSFAGNFQNRTGGFGINNGGDKINSGGFINGQIISKDDKSITIKIVSNEPISSGINDSGSKIIFLGRDTVITKTTDGSLEDLSVGTDVLVTGTTNSDGSITAKSVQIRPLVKQDN